MQTIEQKLADLITAPLADKGLELVQLRLMDGGGKRKLLQVLIENAQTGRVTLDECADASRTISALLDVEDVIHSAFNLEVSSPGIDRPLVKRADFERYLGFEAKIEVKLPIEGRRRFKGQLLMLEGEEVSIKVDAETFTIALANIAHAKLVLTDALLKAYQGGLLGKPIENSG